MAPDTRRPARPRPAQVLRRQRGAAGRRPRRARGEVVTIIGPSGSGKTTLLRCVNLLETYDGGSIRSTASRSAIRDGGDGRRRRRSERELSPIRAETGMVFQLFNLFPHLTALENVMLGLTEGARQVAKAEARRASPSAG